MSSQSTNSINECEQTSEDGLQVLIFDAAWIKAKVFTNNGPHRLKVLLRRHSKPLFLNVDLTKSFKNVASGRDGLPRVFVNIRKRTIKLMLKRRNILLTNELLKGSRRSPESADYRPTTGVLQFIPGQNLG